jgi:hypothetical protein
MNSELLSIDARERRLLIDLLHEAAKLEHCLLDAYLFAACSLKTLPSEFAEVSGGQPNLRRAVQFERVRRWKQALLQVAREEMLHLHYVQCMLRALGEGPAFVLPDRDPDGTWVIPNWSLRVEPGEADGEDGTEIPVTRLDLNAISRFVRYESTDSLQDIGLFDETATDVFDKLRAFELDYHLELALLNVSDDTQRTELKSKLQSIYKDPGWAGGPAVSAAAVKTDITDHTERIQFQSIADLYQRGILPLYLEAFSNGWVINNDRDLNNELQNPNVAQEGFLPIDPVYRDKNFEKAYKADIEHPEKNFKDVREIIQEIVIEGEGTPNFLGRARAMLSKVEELGGARGYLRAVLAEKASRDTHTPHQLAEYERLRQSHLYRFAVILNEYHEEQNLALETGAEFDPTRTQVDVKANAALANIRDDLPYQLNAVYLVLVSWLSRIYETKDWLSDESRRDAIEMIASWPLMSIAIRPLLELVAFFPVDQSLLFRLDAAGLPVLPVLARNLLELYQGGSRSQEIRDRMDDTAVRVLSGVADWAAAQTATVEQADLPEPGKAIILRRLRQAAQLNELEKQFPYRVAGGYSDRKPDITYQQDHPHSDHFEENPEKQKAIFDGFVLRFRFAGWGRAQLATDPDPSMDESGCTGTHMLHAADGNRVLDRALVWQPTEPDKTFTREPADKLPKLGVNGLDVSLLIASTPATAGYMPLSVIQSTGAVETSGVQQDCTVTGLNPVLSPCGDAHGLRFDLLAKDGIRPFLNGMNHIISQDGEPIDPFIFSVSAASSDTANMPPKMLFFREVYNDGKTILEMHPLQRLESFRWPCGFDKVGNIPGWALAAFPAEEQALADPKFPDRYLKRRRRDLIDSLKKALKEASAAETRRLDYVDRIVSLTERLALLGDPSGTTSIWLTYLLHYGHTVSGHLTTANGSNPVLDEIEATCGLSLKPATVADRTKPNARWLATYTKGVMDTDALSDFVYGELYVPLVPVPADQSLHFQYRWALPGAALESVKEYACTFKKPFGPTYDAKGEDQRSYRSDDHAITETLLRADGNGYTYTVEGYPASDYKCSFSVSSSPSVDVQLEWAFSFSCTSPGDITRVIRAAAANAAKMQTALTSHFTPKTLNN